MGTEVEDQALQIKRLERCINDLVSLLSLPAIWSSNDPSQIVEMLLNAFFRMVSPDFVCAQLKDPVTAAPMEIIRVGDSSKLKVSQEDVSLIVNDWLRRNGDDEANSPPTGSRRGDQEISVFPLPLGIHGEIGRIIIGSERADFPTQIEGLLLSVAANQASIGLREAALLREQKRIATELDRRVAERTVELAATNERLKRSEERWRSVFENSAVGVALADLDGKFIATNPVYQKMLGYNEGELRQLTFLDITHEENVEHNQSLIDDGKRQQFQIEKRYRRKDGQIVWVRSNVSIVPGSDQMPRFLLALSEDITQRKLSEEALAKARTELAQVASVTSLGVLTASIAHEVNQPLSGIVTNASTCLRMLSADPPNIDGARETVRRTIRDGNRASEVVTRLRTLYSKKELSVESMNLNEATREVTELSSIELRRSGAMLRCELAEDLPPVFGDRIQLQQVILNLLRNASDAMRTIEDRPRELLIRTERDEANRVRLSVRDSGVGFNTQAVDKIFEAFYTTKTDGMGIGLSISRSIIEAHRGRLWATANDGHGATFSFAIPCALEGSPRAESVDGRIGPPADAA